MSVKRKARPIKYKGETIGLQVEKDRLESDFDGYYKNTCKYLSKELNRNVSSLKIEDYDEETVIMYDKDKNYGTD